ncbi:MAG: cobalamin-dependent protein [Phaeodactylibacter sp.]|nr:cobalamin-dependent protein [Phaeodactylibacter sp.]
MKILFVRPPVPKHTIGLKHVMICEPLELEYVAAGVPEGHDIQIMDMILEKGFGKRLEAFQPDILCTSCYISGVNEVIKLCREAKGWNPTIKTVVGGVHASRCPEDFADTSIDCIVLGDGTSLIATIIEAFEAETSLLQIPGLALPIAPITVLKTEGKAYMPKADTLPFPRRDLVAHLQHKYYYIFHRPVATMKTTWGCWYKCNFCFTWRITDGHPYSRSPESIVAELETIEAEDIYIVDDIFLIKSSRLTKLAELIRARNIRKKYLVYARADYIAENEDIIAEWAELGLAAVFIGLEAATDSELDAMDKECSVDYNEAAIEICRRYGIDIYGSLIPGPDYTEKEWTHLFRFIERNKLYYVNISPLTPMPGTLIWDLYKDRITVPREAHGLWDLSHMLVETTMPIKQYYRWLLKTYIRTSLDFRRAKKYALRTRPPIFSFKYYRIWEGMIKIMIQFLNAHKHHTPKELAKAMYKGPEVPGLQFRDWQSEAAMLEENKTAVQEKVQHEAFQ